MTRGLLLVLLIALGSTMGCKTNPPLSASWPGSSLILKNTSDAPLTDIQLTFYTSKADQLVTSIPKLDPDDKEIIEPMVEISYIQNVKVIISVKGYKNLKVKPEQTHPAYKVWRAKL